MAHFAVELEDVEDYPDGTYLIFKNGTSRMFPYEVVQRRKGAVNGHIHIDWCSTRLGARWAIRRRVRKLRKSWVHVIGEFNEDGEEVYNEHEAHS